MGVVVGNKMGGVGVVNNICLCSYYIIILGRGLKYVVNRDLKNTFGGFCFDAFAAGFSRF